MLQFLAAAYSSPCLGTITRRPFEGWKSEPVAWGLERIAAAVHSALSVVGIRPEGRIRAIWVDIDRKPQAVSPYWHPCGQSRQLQRLEQEAAAAGCITTTLRSSASGGLHVVIAMPEALPAWRAHWVGVELLARSGIELAAGQAELFPSRLAYSASPDPKDWAQSHGVRLPGQEGSALLVGDRTASDTLLIYEQLLADLEATEAGPLWAELLEAARSRQKEAEAGGPQGHTPRRATTRAHGVRWSAAGQTNENLGRLTTWARAAHPHIRTVAELAPIIEAAAIAAPGFTEHASELSQQDLAAWCARWARCSLKRDHTPTPHTPEAGDKHHNRRLFLQSRAALTKLWRSVEAAATELSQRAVAELSGLNRKNVRRHWDFWLQLLGGPHPSLTGGAGLAVLKKNESISSSISPAASAEPETFAARVRSKLQTFANRPKPSRLARRAAESTQSKPSREGSRAPLLRLADASPITDLVPGLAAEPPAARLRPLRAAGGGGGRVPAAQPPPAGGAVTSAPSELPFRFDDRPPDPWRARQRAELAAWLGLAA